MKAAATIRGRVKGGRLRVDEPSDLPEGTEVELAVIDDGTDDLDDEDRARLHAALERGMEEVERGEVVPAEEVIAKLRARRSG